MTLFLIASLLSGPSFSEPEHHHIDSIVVSASNALRNTPMAFSDIDGVQLKRERPASSLPQTLTLQPSVVSTSEGGTGLGYTNFRVRGVGGTQTNVTLNGITLNDAESQEVFWVNIPGLNDIVGNVQLQRGLGTSSAGAGAFGASLNLFTESIPEKAGATLDLGAGSWTTLSGLIKADSPVSRHGLFVRGAYSYKFTEGYIRGGRANVQSAFAVAGWRGRRDLVKFTFLFGDQKTGITWSGCPWDKYGTDRRYNPAEGATDNFRQSHFQLSHSHQFDCGIDWNTTLNYTRGDGYYEYPATGWEGSRDYLANNLWVLRSELKYSAGPLKCSGGAYLSSYDGDHFGRSIIPEIENYRNAAVKREADVWARAEYSLSKVVLYADLQYRGVMHDMKGPDEYGQVLDYAGRWSFFNPRAGASWFPAKEHKLFISAAYGNREPARADIQADRGIKPEKLLDLEGGWSFDNSHGLVLSATLYDMEYFDMLIETAVLDASGYPVKTNVSRAWRRGMELAGSWKASPFILLEGNLSFSANRTSEGKDILLSPFCTGALRGSFILWKGGLVSLSGKLVGKQHWDGSGLSDRVIPTYFTGAFAVSHKFSFKHLSLKAQFDIDNLFNSTYYAYAYSGGVFPAPPINFMGRLSLEF